MLILISQVLGHSPFVLDIVGHGDTDPGAENNMWQGNWDLGLRSPPHLFFNPDAWAFLYLSKHKQGNFVTAYS